jgi:hypothetical protein
MSLHLDFPQHDTVRIFLIGLGATAVMDVWLWGLKRAGVPTLNFALVGRWVGHLGRGRWAHAPISASLPVRHEAALGWLVHYGVGLAFAVLLVGLCGMGWMHQPSLWPALAFGLASAGVPLFVIQPAMGAGIASAKTPAPLKNSLKSVATHTVFGVGLYLSALVIERILP